MTRQPQTEVWADDGVTTVYDPGAMNWGPQAACPFRIVVTHPAGHSPTGRRRAWCIELVTPGVDGGPVALNPGAARWLGNRLIEAALIAEQQHLPAAADTASQDDPRKDPS